MIIKKIIFVVVFVVNGKRKRILMCEKMRGRIIDGEGDSGKRKKEITDRYLRG